MAYPNMIVSGSGSPEIHGTYISNTSSGGRPLYRVFNETYAVIYWSGSDWNIVDSVDNIVFGSADDVATPDLCTTWYLVDTGVEPFPTVTAESAGGGGFPILNGSIVR
jgi:hypothetical protein